jgi:hypothetical protein
MNGTNPTDFAEMLHKIKDMADFMKLYNNTNGNSTHTQQPGGFHRANAPFPPPGRFPPDYFDHMVDSPALRSMKAALPFIELRYRRPLSVFIKLIEIQKLMDVYSDALVAIGDQTGTDWRRGMLYAMRSSVAEDKKGMIDTLLQLMDMRQFLNVMQ